MVYLSCMWVIVVITHMSMSMTNAPPCGITRMALPIRPAMRMAGMRITRRYPHPEAGIRCFNPHSRIPNSRPILSKHTPEIFLGGMRDYRHKAVMRDFAGDKHTRTRKGGEYKLSHSDPKITRPREGGEKAENSPATTPPPRFAQRRRDAEAITPHPVGAVAGKGATPNAHLHLIFPFEGGIRHSGGYAVEGTRRPDRWHAPAGGVGIATREASGDRSGLTLRCGLSRRR